MWNALIRAGAAGKRAGLKSFLLVLMAVVWTLVGFMGRPAVEQNFAEDIERTVGVNVIAKPEGLHLEIPRDYSDATEIMIIAISDKLTIVTLPEGLEELMASGATHLIKVIITERSEKAYARIEIMIPGKGTLGVGIGGVKSFSVEISEVKYPQLPEDMPPDEDGF